jgi:hypothetical protein
VARASITFLEHRILSKEPAQIRRQAVLALAVNPRLEGDEVEVVLKFMKSDSNGWDTFTTGQFFAYHRQQLQASPNFERIKAAVTATDNPHAEDILRDLESKDSP